MGVEGTPRAVQGVLVWNFCYGAGMGCERGLIWPEKVPEISILCRAMIFPMAMRIRPLSFSSVAVTPWFVGSPSAHALFALLLFHSDLRHAKSEAGWSVSQPLPFVAPNLSVTRHEVQPCVVQTDVDDERCVL